MPFPANNRAPAQLRLLDERITAAIMTLDLDMLLSTLRETGSTMCGVLPVSLLMVTLRKLRQPITPTLLAYGTSADVTGDYRTCVGYAALSFERSEPGSPARKQ
jgi:AmmeMemoRadiSam system protein B